MKYEEFNNVSCRASDIKEGDKIRVGGSLMGGSSDDLVVSEEAFQSFFERMDKGSKQVLDKKENLEKWMNTHFNTEFDPEIYAHLFVFNSAIKQIYPDISKNASARRGFYDQEGEKTLASAVELGVCECAEIATLAQLYLQKQGVDSVYFGGEVLNSEEEEYGTQHSFVMISKDKKNYVFDAACPIQDANGMCFPNISKVEAGYVGMKQFENKIHSGLNSTSCAFLETKNIVTGGTAYYGSGCGLNVSKKDIIHADKSVEQGKEKDY